MFDSIRRVVGDGTAKSDDTATQPDLVDTRDLDSLARFDDAIDADYDKAPATSDEPATYATDTVRFGCCLGEVLVRVYGGEWSDETVTDAVVVDGLHDAGRLSDQPFDVRSRRLSVH